MNSVKVKWIGNGSAPAHVRGAGFSDRPYEVKSGVAEIDARDLFTVLNRRAGEWEEVKHVRSTRTTTEVEPDTASAGNDAE